jgi:hypothetical protein
MTTQKPIANAESQQIDDCLKRPALYRNVDGTEEINMGIVGLGLAGSRLLAPLLHASALGGLSWFLYMMVLFAIMHFGSQAIKKRWTYPRTGFAEPRCTNPGGKWVILGAIAVAGGVFGALGALFATRRLSGGPAFLGCGGLLTAVIFAAGIGRRVPWKRWVAAILALGSLALALLPQKLLASVYQGVSIPNVLLPSLLGALFLYGAWMGVVFLTSGLITLRLYIRNTRPAEPDSE